MSDTNQRTQLTEAEMKQLVINIDHLQPVIQLFYNIYGTQSEDFVTALKTLLKVKQ